MQVRHVVELLADMTQTPAIGESDFDLAKAL